MVRKVRTILASTKQFYKILIIWRSFYDEVISLPNKIIEEFHDYVSSLLSKKSQQFFFSLRINILRKIFLRRSQFTSIK